VREAGEEDKTDQQPGQGVELSRATVQAQESERHRQGEEGVEVAQVPEIVAPEIGEGIQQPRRESGPPVEPPAAQRAQ